MSRSRKVCLLRRSAEIESLSNLRKLQHQVQAGLLTEEQAAEKFQAAELPDCAHHHHLTIREARRREHAGRLDFLPGWGEQYAQAAVAPVGGKRFCPSLICSSDSLMGRLEMYAVEA